MNVISELVTNEYKGQTPNASRSGRPVSTADKRSGWSENCGSVWNPEAWDDPEGDLDQLKGIPPHIILDTN
jgi:hypothetical protein